MDKILYTGCEHRSDEISFRVLFEQYHRKLYCYAAWYLPAAQGPEDVVQDAFVKLWQQWPSFQQRGTALSFLYTTIRNHCINIRKHQQVVYRHVHYLRHNLAIESVDIPVMEDPDDNSWEKMFNALEGLPTGCKKVIWLSYLQGMKNKEIAQKLAISINTVKTQKQRGLRVLKQVVM